MRLSPPTEIQTGLGTLLGEKGGPPKSTGPRGHHRTSGLFSTLELWLHISPTFSCFAIQATSRKIDATRSSDGLPVHLYLASEKESPEEADIMLHLTSRKLTGEHNRGNHTIPVLEVLEVDDSRDLCVIVTPLMRACDDPWFENMGEAVDFLGQVLEVGYFRSPELTGTHRFSPFRGWNLCMHTELRTETLDSTGAR